MPRGMRASTSTARRRVSQGPTTLRSRPPRHGRDPARHLLAVHHWGRAARERIADECKRREGLMRSSGVVRLGILGPGYIATRFMRHAREAANAEVVAVGSRTRERAAEFAATFGIARAYACYEALLDDPAVDAVYICMPNSLHHSWTIRALSAGKQVLCEKPYSRHPAEVAEAFYVVAGADRVLTLA